MHPDISQFPSSKFYKNRLKNDASVKMRYKEAEFKNSFIREIQNEYHPISFFDL